MGFFSLAQQLTGVELAYYYLTLVGGTIFIILTVMRFIGAELHAHGGDIGGGAGGGDDGGGHADDAGGPKALTLYGASIFCLMFGLVGLWFATTLNLGLLLSLPVAVAAGVGSMWGVVRLMKWMTRFESSGNIDLMAAIGEVGTVYLTIRQDHPGQVQVSVQGHLMTLDARTLEDDPIPTGTKVLVGDLEDGVLVVTRLDDDVLLP